MRFYVKCPKCMLPNAATSPACILCGTPLQANTLADAGGPAKYAVPLRSSALSEGATATPPRARTCIQCGARVDLSAKFCLSCGTRLERGAPAG